MGNVGGTAENSPSSNDIILDEGFLFLAIEEESMGGAENGRD